MKIIVLFLAFIFTIETMAQTRRPIDPRRYEILSGLRKSKDERVIQEAKPVKEQLIAGKVPAKFLSRNFHYIPEGSLVLDISMGGGNNAVFMARKGYNVTGLEVDKTLSKKAKELADEFGVRISIIDDEYRKYEPTNNVKFDAIICFYYVDRELHEKLISWLRPGGILIYESYTEKQLKTRTPGRVNSRFLLGDGELLNLFPNMRVLKYEEPLHQNEFTSSIILQKPRV